MAYGGLVAGIGTLALLSGNNLVYLLESALLALGPVTWLLGAWNLRNVEVARVLPSELYAGVDGRGRLLVRNRRRWLPALAIDVQELALDADAVRVPVVPAEEEASLPAGWRFPERGPASLDRVRVSSRFPFGLVTRWRDMELTADVLVYPRPLASVGRGEPGVEGQDDGSERTRGEIGEFVGLRPYRAGDPPRAIHWRTTARAGVPMVIQRSGAGAERLVVRVEERRGPAWERELARACGEVLRGFSSGYHVGLDLPSQRFEPRAGEAWRRTLLDALARLPRVEPP
jgi:uncharacterized protein (DUF58 family)